MSLKALPLVFINLSGEMMYILDQRLKAQNISLDKSTKVINDIVSTMFNPRFVEELFKPQELYSKRALRCLFEKLAHASIMRLNTASMDKLYDLMTMVFKYQVFVCPRPEDIFLITLNHLDAICYFINGASSIVKQVDNVYSKLIKLYQSMSNGEMQLLRQSLLNFFQDLQVRVSVFLKENNQHPNGKFILPSGGPIPHGFQVPGTILAYRPDGNILCETKFHSGVQFQPSLPPGSLEFEKQRGTLLGTNVYSSCKSEIIAGEKAVSSPTEMSSIPQSRDSGDSRTQENHAKEELSLLAYLIGQKEPSQCPEFTLLVAPDDYEDKFQEMYLDEQNTVTINISGIPQQPVLNKVLQDLSVEDQEVHDEDLLDLMDAASAES